MYRLLPYLIGLSPIIIVLALALATSGCSSWDRFGGPTQPDATVTEMPPPPKLARPSLSACPFDLDNDKIADCRR